MDTTFKKYEEFGKKWIKGTVIEEIELNGKKFTFNENRWSSLTQPKILPLLWWIRFWKDSWTSN